jgi:hypothetical protein
MGLYIYVQKNPTKIVGFLFLATLLYDQGSF